MDYLLKIDNLSKHFGGVKAINNFNLELTAGRIYGLIGPNGAGKTTIFNVITGIYKPTIGEVYFKGEKITGLAPHQIANKGIGRTFQNIRIFSNLNAVQNVMIADHHMLTYNILDSFLRTKKFREEEKKMHQNACELLDAVGLVHYINSKAGSLPYGHQRKLEIARAMALNPSLLLLDEPAAGMNADESLELVDFIKEIQLKFGLTILMIEHHMDVVTNLCDHCSVLNFGETIAEGTAPEVKCNPQVVTAYLGEEVEHA